MLEGAYGSEASDVTLYSLFLLSVGFFIGLSSGLFLACP